MRITIEVPTRNKDHITPTVVFTIESSESLTSEDCLRELLPTVSTIDGDRAGVVRDVIDGLVKMRSKR